MEVGKGRSWWSSTGSNQMVCIQFENMDIALPRLNRTRNCL